MYHPFPSVKKEEQRSCGVFRLNALIYVKKNFRAPISSQRLPDIFFLHLNFFVF